MLLPTELGGRAGGDGPPFMDAPFPLLMALFVIVEEDFCNTSGLCTALRAARACPGSMLLSDALLRLIAEVLGHLLLAPRPCKLRPGSKTAGMDGDMEFDNAPSVL